MASEFDVLARVRYRPDRMKLGNGRGNLICHLVRFSSPDMSDYIGEVIENNASRNRQIVAGWLGFEASAEGLRKVA